MSEWDCEGFEVCPFEDMLCHKCQISKYYEIEHLVKKQPYIHITNDERFYSILPHIQQYQAQNLVRGILEIIFDS